MADHASLTMELSQLEARLLACWFRGPKFRRLWTPDPAHFVDPGRAALARHAAAMAASGQIDAAPDPWMALIERLHQSGDLNRYWPLGKSPLEMPLEMTPEADLARWRDLRCLIALRHRLQETFSSPAGTQDYPTLRKAILEALDATAPGARGRFFNELELLQMAWEQLRAPSMRSGWFTGFSELDGATGGLRPGETWVIGAPTNWGKSAFCLAVADHFLSVNGKGVLFVTCEDPPGLLSLRLMCRRAGVRGKDARLGRISQAEMDRCANELARASARRDVPIMLDGRGIPVETLCSDIQSAIARHGPMLVIADYLQCIRTERKTDNRRHEINHIGQTLAKTCQRLGCPMLLASQLTGEHEALRESQDTENEASVVLVGRRKDDGSMWLLLRKNKAAPDRMFEMQLDWNSTTGCFVTRQEENYDDLFDPTTDS